MGGLREAHLGPIVGHTTPTTCRVWIRGGDPADKGSRLDSERRTIGIAALYDDTEKRLGKPFYFRLHREFDRTGTFNVGADQCLSGAQTPKLKPDTAYYVRVGVLSLDDPYPDGEMIADDDVVAALPSPERWNSALESLEESKSRAGFRTHPQKAEKFGFLLGSCRYPGLIWKVKRSDKIFGAVRREAVKERAGSIPRLILMTGDQIYADKYHRLVPIGRADTFEEFQERYHTAFSSPNMRGLLRSLPTYMILDDHEIEDNWSQDRLRRDGKYHLFNIAMDAYLSYQWSHGPRSFGRRTYYHFDCAGYPFFVLDTRTTRYYNSDPDNLSENHLLGYPSPDPQNNPSQLDRFLQWLSTQPKKVPKFVVSPSAFVPNPVMARAGSSARLKEECDSWPGFPNTRRAILQAIVSNKIQNVIFLSGDVHCSNVARITFERDGKKLPVSAFSVTSSAFYWPFCFADGDPSDFIHDSRDPRTPDPFPLDDGLPLDDKRQTVMHYTASNFTQEDNFTRVDVDRATQKLVVRVFDDEGRPVLDAAGGKLEATLDLEKW